MLSLCSHVIAVTCEYIRDADCVTGYSTYDRSTIEMMLEKLVSTKPAAHRPPKTMRGTQIQKEAAVEVDSSDDEDVDEDFLHL